MIVCNHSCWKPWTSSWNGVLWSNYSVQFCLWLIVVSNYTIILIFNFLFVSGHPSAYSSICRTPSAQSPTMETLLDFCPLCNDLCYADKPQGVDRHGTPETCQLVHQQMQKEETPSTLWLTQIRKHILFPYIRFSFTGEALCSRNLNQPSWKSRLPKLWSSPTKGCSA